MGVLSKTAKLIQARAKNVLRKVNTPEKMEELRTATEEPQKKLYERYQRALKTVFGEKWERRRAAGHGHNKAETLHTPMRPGATEVTKDQVFTNLEFHAEDILDRMQEEHRAQFPNVEPSEVAHARHEWLDVKRRARGEMPEKYARRLRGLERERGSESIAGYSEEMEREGFNNFNDYIDHQIHLLNQEYGPIKKPTRRELNEARDHYVDTLKLHRAKHPKQARRTFENIEENADTFEKKLLAKADEQAQKLAPPYHEVDELSVKKQSIKPPEEMLKHRKNITEAAKKKGYTLETTREYKPDDAYGDYGDEYEQIRTSIKDKNGKEVGWATFRDIDGEHLVPDDMGGVIAVRVDEGHRRKGLASVIYAQAEKDTGQIIKRSDSKTYAGESFWDDQVNRPFGSQELKVKNPASVRSPYANFDPRPAFRKSKNIYAGLGGLSVGAASLLGGTEEAEASTMSQAKKILAKVDSAEKAVKLTGEKRAQYLEALDTVYGTADKRAKDMGFGPNTYYHGTAGDIKEFDLKASPNFEVSPKGAIFASDNPEVASDFADHAGYKKQSKKDAKAFDKQFEYFGKTGQWPAGKYEPPSNRGDNVLPVKFRLDNPLIAEGRGVDAGTQKLINQARESGKDSFVLNNAADNINQIKSTTVGVLDPSAVRSVHAAFDPRFAKSKNILAGVGGLSAGAAALLGGQNQAQAGELPLEAERQSNAPWAQTPGSRLNTPAKKWTVPPMDPEVEKVVFGDPNRPSIAHQVLELLSVPQREMLNAGARAAGVPYDPKDSEMASQNLVEKAASSLGIPEDSTLGNAAKGLGVAGLEVLADPVNLIPLSKIGRGGKGLYEGAKKAGDSLMDYKKSLQLNPAALDKLYKGGMIQEGTFKRMSQNYASGGQVTTDPAAQLYASIAAAQPGQNINQSFAPGVSTGVVPKYQAPPGTPGWAPIDPNSDAQTMPLPNIGPSFSDISFVSPASGADTGSTGLTPEQTAQAESLHGSPEDTSSAERQQALMQGYADIGRTKDKAYQQMEAGAWAQANAQQAMGLETKGVIEEGVKALKDERDKQMAQDAAAHTYMREKLTNYEVELDKMQSQVAVDPDRFWKNKTTGQRIGMAIGIALSGINGKGNQAMDSINAAINRDIDAQKADAGLKLDILGKKNTVFQQMLNITGDQRLAYLASYHSLSSIVDNQVKAAAAGHQGALARSQALGLSGQINERKADAKAEFLKLLAVSPGLMSQNEDMRKISSIGDEKLRERARDEYAKFKQHEATKKLVTENMRTMFEYRRYPKGSDGYLKAEAAETAVSTLTKEFYGGLSKEEMHKIPGIYPNKLTDSEATYNYKLRQMQAKIDSLVALPTLEGLGIVKPHVEFKRSGK